jgi:hypothetical protein
MAWLLAAWLVCACNVGDALVDTQKEPEGGLVLPCRKPPPCEPLTENTMGETHPVWYRGNIELSALAVERSSCLDAPAESACDPTAADAGSHDPAETAPMEGCSARSDLPPTAACDDVRVAGDPASPLSSLDAPNWSRSNLTLVASSPWRVELHAPILDMVFLRLEGPVELHIDHANALEDLRITGVITAAGAPSLELRQVIGNALAIGDAVESFPGSVRLETAVLSESVLAPVRLELRSVELSKVRVLTSALSGTDASLVDAVIDADSVLLSAFKAARTRIQSCADATYVAGTVMDTSLASCRGGGALRVYDTKILSSAVDGIVESDGSSWEYVRLGVNAPSDVVLFLSSWSAVAICEGASRIGIGTASSVKCSGCKDLLDEPDVCIIPGDGRAPNIDANFCHLLTADPKPAECVDPVPERIRPIDPM